MAKTGGRNFKKGEVSNPRGRPPLPPDVKAALKLTRESFAREATELLTKGLPELSTIVRDPASSSLRVLIASVIINAIKVGDDKRLNTLLDRLIGKVMERSEVSLKAPRAILFEPASKQGT